MDESVAHNVGRSADGFCAREVVLRRHWFDDFRHQQQGTGFICGLTIIANGKVHIARAGVVDFRFSDHGHGYFRASPVEGCQQRYHPQLRKRLEHAYGDMGCAVSSRRALAGLFQQIQAFAQFCRQTPSCLGEMQSIAPLE